ncbi:hypothetical protein NPX13_g4142 [Xylaria arbuscula]|uniref:Uncharacterized protein n=1 Tax=Xylaria arbuscula TaxID=114810 RepID=A0A9W8NG12_9PEZI|nr:hypothetical protein NPX13_g4142 [Xylaria arbuscula]
MLSQAIDTEKSLLLDYISLSKFKTPYKAALHRHWGVLASAVGYMIIMLQIVIVVSTVLIQPSPTLPTKTVPVTTTSHFNESAFWDFVKSHYDQPVFDFNLRSRFLYYKATLAVNSLDSLYMYADIPKHNP